MGACFTNGRCVTAVIPQELEPRVIRFLFGTTEEAAEKLENSAEMDEKRSSGAEARIDFVGFMRGLKPPPPSGQEFFRRL
jgi:hypothetical protein